MIYLKKIIAVSLISLLFIIVSFKSIVPVIFLNIGKSFYENKNYNVAHKVLKVALDFNDKHKDARYYYVKSLINLEPDIQMQKELYEFANLKSGDSASFIADKEISKIRKQAYFNIGENYIEQVPFNNKILRWDSAKFPLNIYIENTVKDLPSYYIEQIFAAFSQWQSSTAGLIKFKTIQEKKDAQITVKIVSIGSMSMCTKENCKYVVAYTTPVISGDLLKRMDIIFYDANNLSKHFTPREVYNVALHELGHALGIMGHSYNKDNLMYMENNLDKTYDRHRSVFQLISPVDLDTLQLLYRLAPEITNTDLNKLNTKGLIYPPIVMGSDQQISSRGLMEAQNYISSAPDLPNGYIQLASVYAGMKEYDSAIDALNKAMSLSSNNSERYVVYYNFAVIYMNVQNWNDALKYADLAKSIAPESGSDIEGLIAAINFNKGNRDFAKQAYIEALSKHPDKIVDSINLAKIYLGEFNFVQAGKILNRLIKANPEAKNDSRLKPYGLLIFLFK